jgi:hypothetical protein
VGPTDSSVDTALSIGLAGKKMGGFFLIWVIVLVLYEHFYGENV